MPYVSPTDYQNLYKIIRRKNISAKVIFEDSEGRILLVKSPNKDYWSLPGGICEMSEAPSCAAIRETKEELGLNIQDPRLVSVVYYARQDIDGITFFFYGGKLRTTTIQNIQLDSQEISDFKMLIPGKALALVKPETKTALSRILQDSPPRFSYFEHPVSDIFRNDD